MTITQTKALVSGLDVITIIQAKSLHGCERICLCQRAMPNFKGQSRKRKSSNKPSTLWDLTIKSDAYRYAKITAWILIFKMQKLHIVKAVLKQA